MSHETTFYRMRLTSLSISYSLNNFPTTKRALQVRLIGWNWEMELKVRIEGNGIKMESRGKLGNDEKVKFVGPKKSVRWREKICGS